MDPYACIVVLVTSIVSAIGLAEQSAVVIASAQLILLYGFTTENLAWSFKKAKQKKPNKNDTKLITAIIAVVNFGLLVASAEIGNERFYWPYLIASFLYALSAGNPNDENAYLTQSVFVQFILLLTSVCLTVAHASVQEGGAALGTSIAAAVLATIGDGILTTMALYQNSDGQQESPWFMVLYTLYFIIVTPGFIYSEAAGPIALALALAHLVGGTLEASSEHGKILENAKARWEENANVIADVVIALSLVFGAASVGVADQSDLYQTTPRGLGLAGLSLATLGNVFCVYARMK